MLSGRQVQPAGHGFLKPDIWDTPAEREVDCLREADLEPKSVTMTDEDQDVCVLFSLSV